MSVQLLYDNNMFTFYYISLTLRKCKGTKWEVPTIEVSDDIFVAPVGVIFSKIIKGMYIHKDYLSSFHSFRTMATSHK